MATEKFSIKKRLQSFVYAFAGLKTLFKEEHNARIHVVVAVVVIVLGLLFHISAMEWLAVLLCIALVFSLELINSAIENLADYTSPDKNDFIRRAKDMAAAAVLVSAMVSVVVGIIIFLPRIIGLINTSTH
ncbi:MAG: diacylglycerol kinase family protein [Dysgonomonas sp.]